MTVKLEFGNIWTMKDLSLKTKEDIEKAAKEFGFESKEDFISQAIKEKILELKKMKFFVISEKIRKGLLKKGIKPEEFLKELKS